MFGYWVRSKSKALRCWVQIPARPKFSLWVTGPVAKRPLRPAMALVLSSSWGMNEPLVTELPSLPTRVVES
ncbi:hypothetical protein D3C87_1391720 [compost metagenome]